MWRYMYSKCLLPLCSLPIHFLIVSLAKKFWGLMSPNWSFFPLMIDIILCPRNFCLSPSHKDILLFFLRKFYCFLFYLDLHHLGMDFLVWHELWFNIFFVLISYSPTTIHWEKHFLNHTFDTSLCKGTFRKLKSLKELYIIVWLTWNALDCQYR